MDKSNDHRLNPFALPAETDVRFNLFVAVALTLTAVLGFIFTVLLWRFGFITLSFDPPGARLDELTLGNADNRTIFAQMLAEVWSWLVLPVGLTLAVLGLSNVFYRLHPHYVRRGRSLSRVTAGQKPELFQAVEKLADQAGLVSVPAVEIEPRLMIPYDGQIFGFPRNYRLRMDGWTPATISKAPGRFRAFILHELAHIINQDVSRYYFALALWAAVILLGLAPLVLSHLIRVVFWQQTTPLQDSTNDWPYFFTEILPRFLIVIVQVGVITSVVMAIFRSLTWVREFYADWRTALWGVEGPLIEIICSKMEEGAAKTKGWRNRIHFIPARHPTGQQRVAFLQQPLQLFTVKADLPFFVGFLIAFLVVGVIDIGSYFHLVILGLTRLISLDIITTLTAWLPPAALRVAVVAVITQVSTILPTYITVSFFLAMGALIASTVGLQVQRQTLAGMAAGNPPGYERLWQPAFMLALGVQAGFLAIPASPLAPIHYALRNFIFHFLLAPVWIIAFSSLAWLWLSYARFFSKRVLGAYSSVELPDRPRRWLTVVLGVVLWIMLIPGVLGQYLIVDYAYDPAALSDPLAQTLPWPLFYFSLPASLLLYGLIFGLSFGFLWLWRTIRPTTCSACGAITQQPYTVGRECEHCRQPLAPWLFVSPVTTAERLASSHKFEKVG